MVERGVMQAQTRSRSRASRPRAFDALKRRVAQLGWLDTCEVIWLREGLFLADVRAVRETKDIVHWLRTTGTVPKRTFEAATELASPLRPVSAQLLASAHHDLRVLEHPVALDLARENRRALARHGVIDRAWIDARRARLAEMTRLAEANVAMVDRPATQWFDGIVEIVRATRGREEAARLAAAAASIQALPRERREEAWRRVDAVCEALETGVIAPALTHAIARLEAARGFPARARRRRILEVLRGVTGFPDAPASLISTQEDFVAMVRQTGHAMASSLPIVRDPAVQQRSLLLLAHLALRLSIGEDHVPPLPDEETRARLEKLPSLFELATPGITLPQALALAAVPIKQTTRRVVARWVAEGLDVELVALAAKHGHGDELAQLSDMRSARAYATWVSRLADHYKARGIRFTLSPDLFAHLPKNEDLGVLAMCLMEQMSPSPAASGASAPPKGDPIAILDATLALFQRLPDKAKHVLDVLRSAKAGEGRRLYPALTAWLGDDGSALVDRCVHLARLAREEPALSAAIREDFEHADRAKRERAYLEQLSARSAPQQGRLDAIRRGSVTVHASPRGRTLRRLQERIDRLLPIAYRNELDGCFREILEEAWGIAVPSLTPAWRDAVRFLLTADGNRTLLLELLRKAARAPGRDVKLTFEKNAAWIARAKDHLDVDAWLAPRRREFSAGDQRFVLEVEEDPLEVLRMGIPFGTCLALGSGCNASSTVMNAIDANKRVLYVRLASSSSSKTRGAVVARKLVALSKSHQIIGYNLYVSIAGPAEIAIREHVLAECRALASAARTTLAPTGQPEQIHAGFWYDDGTVPFDEDVDVAAYCRSLGLPPPPKWFEDLGREAHGFRACETNDLEAAISVLSVWEHGPANRALGEWVVDRLGVRGAAARAANDSSIFVALADALAGGRMEPETSGPSRPSQADPHARARSAEQGMLRVLDLAPRLPESASQHRLSSLLARFPPSPKLAAGICDMGIRAVKRFGRSNDHGLAHLTMNELPPMLSDVAGAFDLLDTIEPVWSHVTKQHPRCEACAKSAVAEATYVALRLYESAPDPDVVVATLMNKHRSATAQCVALHIAARHVLPDGDRALVRLRALRPRLASSPDGIAAVLRQTAFAAGDPCVTADFARRHLPKPSQLGPTFEALRDLVRMDGLEHLFGADRLVACAKRVDEWDPGPWELAWRRRRAKDEPDRVALHEALFVHAARRPYRATRALELLALLGDVERVDAHGRIEDDRPKTSKKAAPKDEPKLATRHENMASCRHTAVSIAAQVAADRTIASKASRVPAFVASAMPHSDALYIDRARRVLLADSSTSAERDAARSVVLGCTLTDVIDWRRVLARTIVGGDIVTARRVFESGKLAQTSLSPAEMVEVWHGASAQNADGDDEVIRGLLAKQIAGALGIGGASTSGDWAARIWAAEREALARGLSIRWGLHPHTPIEGLLEEVALSFADLDRDEEALDVVTLDQLRTVVSAITSRGSPPSVAAAYDNAHDTLTTALFVRAIRRQPPERAGAIREAIKARLGRADTPKNQARQAWVETTRTSVPLDEPLEDDLRNLVGCSIERE